MPASIQADLVARLEKETRGQRLESSGLYAWWDFLADRGLIENWTAFHDFTGCVHVGDKLYVKKGNQILVQDLSGKHKIPTCYNCGQDVAFRPVKVLTCCAEGDFEHPDRMPYCPRCEDEPSGTVLHYG